MARVVLAIGAAAWLLGALAATGIGLIGTGRLAALLPPLAIDGAALGGALMAVGAALALAGLAHLTTLLWLLRRGRRRALSAAILLCGCCAAVFVALAAAAFASAAAEPSMAISLLAAGAVGVLAALAYLLATARFIGELGARARA